MVIGNLRKKGFGLVYSFRELGSIVAGKAWHQESELADHIFILTQEADGKNNK